MTQQHIKPADLRSRAKSRAAAEMRAQGFTSRQIAAELGIEPEQVKSRVLHGQRLMQEDEKTEGAA